MLQQVAHGGKGATDRRQAKRTEDHSRDKRNESSRRGEPVQSLEADVEFLGVQDETNHARADEYDPKQALAHKRRSIDDPRLVGL